MSEDAAGRIRPWGANPFYWEYRGEPVLLLGGSVEDNLFQIPDVEKHLDLLADCGGNYVRCTMSSRDQGDVWPFERAGADGPYDLEKPGAEYWGRFERFLELTAERDIILQIEVWDRFDYARDPWQLNPFNPKNNVNYTTEESGLPERIDTHPGERESCFFRSVPNLENNELLLGYQHRHADELLRRTLPRGNVLYCMDNETNESPEWGAYWSAYIHAKADEAGVEVHTTEMWDAWDLGDEQHENTWGHPETYSFVDISQNNQKSGQEHWDNALAYRQRIVDSGAIRPVNTVKTYGCNTGHFGRSRDGIERFWRHVIVGVAAVRFHRPLSGLGLSERARRHIRSARMLSEEFDVMGAEPANGLLVERSNNEAYCAAVPGRACAVFFTDGGDLYLDVSASGGGGRQLSLRWLDAATSRWSEPGSATPEDGKLHLVTPREEGYWLALVRPS